MIKRTALTIVVLIAAVNAALADGADKAQDTTKWYNKTHNLREVTITKKRSKYSRKNNPAVELMRKVIAAKKITDIKSRDYYKYDKYQKLTMAVNDVTPEDLTSGLISKIPGALNQVEVCEYNNKLILPITVSETVTKHLYRKSPKREKTITTGDRSGGIGELFRMGDNMTEALKDFFTDINIYDNQIRLLQQSFTSPISDGAIAFYRFFIVDTVAVERDSCIHLAFSPNNPQDFGFSGEIFIMNDGSYQVRRCEMSIPKKSGVNYINGIKTLQEFNTLADGTRVLTVDDMVVEMSFFDFLEKAIVVRNTRLTGYSFDEIADEMFSGKAERREEADSKMRGEEFWQQNRQVRLTGSEEHMDDFVTEMENDKGVFMYVRHALKLLIENFVETGTKEHPSKVDIGPLTTLVSSNFIDGFRIRLGGQTTANLSPHLFLKGYYAHGFKSKRNYYNAELTYAFNRKQYLPAEFPLRNITVASAYDVCAPTDKFMVNDKDNVFTSFKWTKVDKMMFYRRHQIKLEREEYFGLRTTLQFKVEENEACGSLAFVPLSASSAGTSADASSAGISQKLNTTELRLELRYAPGEKIVNTKQRRHPLNLDAPVFTLSHSMGFSGVLGGDYRYNFTEMTFFKRLWMRSWGHMDVNIRGGVQWNQVPFPLLIMPAANLSYIIQPGTFGLIGNMEFLNDRYASLHIEWDMNGMIFNRIPLLKKLKWREFIGVRTLWGTLTDKNNPALSRNAGSSVLMAFPEGCNVMDAGKPYVEVVAGVHNIFRFFHVEYVRRLTYLDLPSATKHGIRVKTRFRF